MNRYSLNSLCYSAPNVLEHRVLVQLAPASAGYSNTDWDPTPARVKTDCSAYLWHITAKNDIELVHY